MCVYLSKRERLSVCKRKMERGEKSPTSTKRNLFWCPDKKLPISLVAIRGFFSRKRFFRVGRLVCEKKKKLDRRRSQRNVYLLWPCLTVFHLSIAVVKTQNNVYEILSDVNSRQDIMDERIANLEDRLNAVQVSLDLLPDMLSRLETFPFTHIIIAITKF